VKKEKEPKPNPEEELKSLQKEMFKWAAVSGVGLALISFSSLFAIPTLGAALICDNNFRKYKKTKSEIKKGMKS